MNIVACAVEPEFITVENIGAGALDLNIEIARISYADGTGRGRGQTTGSIQLHLLPADVETLTRRLGELLMEAQREHSLRVGDTEAR